MPPLLGEIKGTPTIRFYKPKTKQGNSDRKKIIMDYEYERKAVAMKNFADTNMPNFVEKVSSGKLDYEKFNAKGVKHGLPRVLLFTSKAGSKTSNLTKFLSAEFRRRILIAEIKPTKPNQDILDQFGITDLPAMIIVPPPQESGNENVDPLPVQYEGGKFTKNKLTDFISKHALKTAVVSAPKKKQAPPRKEENKKESGSGDADGKSEIKNLLMKDPNVAEAMKDPKVALALQKLTKEPGGMTSILSNPAKLKEYTSDPEIGSLIEKLMEKMAGKFGIPGDEETKKENIKVEL